MREKRKREHSAAFPRKRRSKKSRARRKQKEGSKKRERAFLLLSFSPHLRVYKNTTLNYYLFSWLFIIRREDNEQSLTFTAQNHSAKRRSRLWEEKLFALRFVSFFVCPREKESNWKKWSGQSSNHHQTKTGRPGRYPNRVLTTRASLWMRTVLVRRKF